MSPLAHRLKVVGHSMLPTLHDGEVILAVRFPTALIPRGTLVVFENPHWQAGTSSPRFLVKRLTAHAGDQAPPGIPGSPPPPTAHVVPAGHVVVTGDAVHSQDSRHLGFIHRSTIFGPALRLGRRSTAPATVPGSPGTRQ